MSVIRRLEIVEYQMQELSTLPTRMAGVEGRLTGVENRLTSVENRLTGVEDRLTSLENRFSSVEEKLDLLRGEFDDFRIEVRSEFVRVRADGEETRRHMRVLHEDILSRIALLQEGIARINGTRSSNSRRKRR